MVRVYLFETVSNFTSVIEKGSRKHYCSHENGEICFNQKNYIPNVTLYLEG